MREGRGVAERDDAVGVDLSVQRIDEGYRCGAFDTGGVRGEEGVTSVGFGEGAGAVLIERGNGGGEGRVSDLTDAFVVGEEEGVVFPDGTAEGPAELVADENWLRRLAGEGVGRRSEGSDGVEDCVAEIVPCLTVKLIGTAANADIDDAACGAAILCGVVVGFDTEFVDGVRGRRDGLVGESLIRGSVGVVVDTVEKEVVEFAALAIDVEGGVAAAGGGVLEDVAADAGD